jgi:hypothetical protein
MNFNQNQPGASTSTSTSSGFRNTGNGSFRKGKEREQDQQYIPDIPVSVLTDPRAKAHMKKSLNKVAKETQQGVKLDDNASEVNVKLILSPR